MKLHDTLLLLPALWGAALLSSCASAPRVDPGARQVLQETTDKLRSAQTIEVTGNRVADPALLPEGSTREFVNFDLAVKRPGHLAVKSSDGEGIRHIVAGDGGITMYDEKANIYTTTDTEETTVDGLVDDIESKFDMKMALSEMLGEDPMKNLMEDVRTAKVVGDEKVGATLCTRLDFHQRGLDWQLWVAKSDALPRMLSLTYTDKPGNPKRVVTINKWKLNGRIPPSLFTFRPKRGAEEVEVLH